MFREGDIVRALQRGKYRMQQKVVGQVGTVTDVFPNKIQVSFQSVPTAYGPLVQVGQPVDFALIEAALEYPEEEG